MTGLVERLDRMLSEDWLPVSLRAPATGSFRPGEHETCVSLMRHSGQLAALYPYLGYHLRHAGLLRLEDGAAVWATWRRIRAAALDARVNFYVTEWWDVAAERARLGPQPSNRLAEFRHMRTPPVQLLEGLTPGDTYAFLEYLGHRRPVADARYALFEDFVAWFERASPDVTLVAPVGNASLFDKVVQAQRDEMALLAATLRRARESCRNEVQRLERVRAAAQAQIDAEDAARSELGRSAALLPFERSLADDDGLPQRWPAFWQARLPPAPATDAARKDFLEAVKTQLTSARAVDVDAELQAYIRLCVRVSVDRSHAAWRAALAPLEAQATALGSPLPPAPVVIAEAADRDERTEDAVLVSLLALDHAAALEQLIREVSKPNKTALDFQQARAAAVGRALPTNMMRLRLAKAREEAAARACHRLNDRVRPPWTDVLRVWTAAQARLYADSIEALRTQYEQGLDAARRAFAFPPSNVLVDNAWFVELLANTAGGRLRSFADISAMPTPLPVSQYRDDLLSIVWYETLHPPWS